MSAPENARLYDRFGRRHNNLRLSVTDRCNIRCVYCMPEEVQFLPREGLLTFEELARFAGVAARLGVNKLRLTGGEPLVRKDVDRLVALLAGLSGIEDIGLTTNAMLLAPVARDLKRAGLSRLNISLDTLDPVRFEQISRRRGLGQVLEGIQEAKAVGFDRIKINAVAIRGINEPDIVPLAEFAREHGFELRFIEYMPLDAVDQWERSKVLFADEILARLASGIGPLAPAARLDGAAPAEDYAYVDGKGRVGIIASVSKPFCGSCNRVRLTADGKLRNCLFALDETDIRAILRSGGSDDELAGALIASVEQKWEGHQINQANFIKPERLMHSIGG